jgi:hypothetical protein
MRRFALLASLIVASALIVLAPAAAQAAAG